MDNPDVEAATKITPPSTDAQNRTPTYHTTTADYTLPNE